MNATRENTNQKNCYKKDDGILIGGYAVTTVPSRSTVSLDSPNGAFFLAMAAGNNYGGCAYLVSSSYGGINNVFTLFEKIYRQHLKKNPMVRGIL